MPQPIAVTIVILAPMLMAMGFLVILILNKPEGKP
jgi:hypothetical protein